MKTRKPYNILLVDDDEDDGFLFGVALKEIDQSIIYTSYYDSERALHDLKSHKLSPDYIFLDINMPKINGIEMLRELKSIQRFLHIPIIICSTTTNREHIAEVKALGAEYFICKPNSMIKLVQEIKNALRAMHT